MPRRVVSTSGSSGTPSVLHRQGLQQTLAHLPREVELELLVGTQQHQLRRFAQHPELERSAVAQLDRNRFRTLLSAGELCGQARGEAPVVDPAIEIVLARALLFCRRQWRERPFRVLLRDRERLEGECRRRLARTEQVMRENAVCSGWYQRCVIALHQIDVVTGSEILFLRER